MKPLDAIDKHILNILQTDGRIANVELAKRVHLSPTPCLDRVRRLERDGYILGYRADLNPERLRCGFVTFMTVSLDRTTEDVFDKFARSVATLEEIVECHMVGGGFDYILKIRTASMAAFRAFMAKKLSTLPEVAQTHSYFVMEEVKDSPRLVVS
jgi:Lrp/AsnC family leucine-responsive transcriptional regulator